MAKMTPKEFNDEFTKVFGLVPNASQLWFLVKFSKYVRLRCRNNNAFNNFMNGVFPHARFRTVQKERKSYKTGLMEKYDGLAITVAPVV